MTTPSATVYRRPAFDDLPPHPSGGHHQVEGPLHSSSFDIGPRLRRYINVARVTRRAESLDDHVILGLPEFSIASNPPPEPLPPPELPTRADEHPLSLVIEIRTIVYVVEFRVDEPGLSPFADVGRFVKLM